MVPASPDAWKQRTVPPETPLRQLRPGMRIFLSTGTAEPTTMVRHLMASSAGNLQDLELIQLVSFGDMLSPKNLQHHKFRLKTFFSGWVADAAITEGRVDLIPSRFAWIPELFEPGRIAIDAAFVQVSPPNASGDCSFGIAVDVGRQAIENAAITVGEINPWMPFTYGETLISAGRFDYLVEAAERPIQFDRWTVDAPFEKVARNVAGLIENGSCLAFSIGPLYEALAVALRGKRDLGIHSPFFTDALMDLVETGAVTNRFKALHRGKSVAAYALGTHRLYRWLHHYPEVAFRCINEVFDPVMIGRNPGFVAVLPARAIDVTGYVALHIGKGNIATGPAEVIDFHRGAELSDGGRTIFALPSRNTAGEANIHIHLDDYPNRFGLREGIDTVVTDYGVAHLKGKTLRERAQSLIDIAHPDDRAELVSAAKLTHILYPDQIFIEDSSRLYPEHIETTHTFKDGLEVRFRGIKPSDEEEMRRLFYRFSDQSVYSRYFTTVQVMPHSRMQAYVNVDWREILSLVGVVGTPGHGRIIAEARYIRDPHRPWAEVVFVVDEAYQGCGIATYLYQRLIELGKERGIRAFHADVLFANIGMMKVFRKGPLKVTAELEEGVYHLSIPLAPAPVGPSYPYAADPVAAEGAPEKA